MAGPRAFHHDRRGEGSESIYQRRRHWYAASGIPQRALAQFGGIESDVPLFSLGIEVDEFERKGRSLVQGGLHLNGLAMCFDDVLDDRQPQSGASGMAGAAFVHAVEALVNAVEVFFGDANAVVFV